MPKWFHKVDLDWLRTRQAYLTATDVKDLLPVTKTGRKRIVDDEAYLKVFGRKSAWLVEADCISTGAAARGHILEPYAIKCFNDNTNFPRLYHWDDELIAKDAGRLNGLAYSPDALDISTGSKLGKERFVGEVKCYGIDKHTVCGYTKPENLEERWQIATAMAVSPVEAGFLIFYNPSSVQQMFVADYSRLDLKDEIEMVLEVEENWLKWLDNMVNLDHNLIVSGIPYREQEIISAIMKKEELNPESEKSVIM